jgi:hypothetical protein
MTIYLEKRVRVVTCMVRVDSRDNEKRRKKKLEKEMMKRYT